MRSPLACTVVRTRPELEELLPAWQALYEESRSPNPFAHPAWVTAWLDHYTHDEELFVVAARLDGRLVGLAPFYRRRLGRGRGVCLRLAGMGAREAITEIPEIVVAREPARKVLRAISAFLIGDCGSEWDWCELTLGPSQGWFESDWIEADAERRGARYTHLATLAFVVVELPETLEVLSAGLKRNVKEAIRRSTNRLARVDGGVTLAEPRTVDELDEALEALVSLHRARSQVIDKELHGDYLQDGRDDSFLRDAARRMFAAGAATVKQVHIGGAHAASRLVLRGNDSIFFSVSGLERTFWDYGLGTAIMAAALRDAIARGDRTANLSLNPDEAKLRWSERLELHNEFLLVSPRRGARTATLLYLLQRAGRLGRSFWR